MRPEDPPVNASAQGDVASLRHASGGDRPITDRDERWGGPDSVAGTVFTDEDGNIIAAVAHGSEYTP